MAQFSYTALDNAGHSRNGTISADDRRGAARQLVSQGLRLLSLQAANSTAPTDKNTSDERDASPAGGAAASVLDAPPPRKLSQRRAFGPHLIASNFVDSFYQLHANGLPMGDAVKLLGQRVSEPSLRYLCQSLWRDMSEGATLAGAMSRFPVVFDNATLYLIEAGESTGNLVPVLRKVLDSYALREDLRTKVISSIAYPLGICSMAVGVLALFVFFLIPNLQNMMTKLHGEFPLPVKVLMALSDFLIKGSPFIVAVVLLIAFAFTRWRKKDSGRLTTDRWFLRLPVIGAVVLHTETVRMTDLLATLMSSGINATDALRLCERPVENRILRQRLSAGRQMINDGAAFASAFKRHAILPVNDLDILAVGENTGSLADTFQTIAKRHIAALDKAVRNLIRVITAIVLGSTVSLVFMCVISIVLTVLSVSKGLRH
ncbi:MAG: type II secretion system F family protein [Puniceicoccales bacterium]|jgi:type II secretory pathway component PulF|nr:type II secretion system F family protein [Puniceicoccales bacterium]